MDNPQRDKLVEILTRNSTELCDALKKRRLYIRDFAEFAAELDDTDSVDSLSDSTGELYNLFYEASERALRADREGMAQAAGYTSDIFDCADAAAFCRRVAAGIRGRPAHRHGGQENEGRICYFRNNFSDTALSRFEGLLGNTKVEYTGDFTSACEGVYFGKYDYCILPGESFSDGTLSRFIGLMHKYELYISLACRVNTPDDGYTTMYLLSGTMTYFEGSDRLALTAIPAQGYPLWKLLCTAEQLGALCLTCTALPRRIYEDGAYYLIFDITKADTGAFFAALQLTFPSYGINGIYRQLEANELAL